MLQDGFPLSLSVGALHPARGSGRRGSGPRLYRVTRWRLQELSVVVYGRTRPPTCALLGQDEDAEMMVARMNAAEGGSARAAVRNNLRLDEWERWAVPTAVRLAEKLGVDDAGVRIARQEVRQRCEQFVADLAA